MADSQKSHSATRARKLGLLIFGVLAGLLIAEIVLRAAGISYPRFYVVDQHIGYVHKPGAAGWYRAEGEGYVEINSHGMRDKEHSEAKPENTYRIAIIGDSYSEARQVNIEDTYWSVMERELQSCGALEGKTVEVLNFGVSGYGTAQHLLSLRYRALAFAPDLILLQVCMNDVKDNSREISGNSERPYFVYRDGELVLDDAFRTTPQILSRQSWSSRIGYLALDHCQFLQLLNDRRKKLRDSKRVKFAVPANGPPALDPFGSGMVTAFREPLNPEYAEAWRVTEGLIVKIRDEAERHGADFLVVSVSSPEQVHPDENLRKSIAASVGVADLSYFDSRISALGERNGFSVLALSGPFLAHAEQHNAYLHGFSTTELGVGHWNADGHRLGGEIIAKRICDRLAERKSEASREDR